MRIITVFILVLFPTLVNAASDSLNGKHILMIHRLGNGSSAFSQQEYADYKSCKNAAEVFLTMIPDAPVKKMYNLRCVPYKLEE